eukprot:403353175
MRFQSTRQCRICFEDISRFDFSRAVRPCKCKGTQQFVHHKCLKKWLDFSNHTQCHVCLFKFEKYKRKDGCAKILYNMLRSHKGLFFIIQVLQCLFAKMITKVSLYNLKMGHQLKISLVPSVYMQMIDSIISFQPLYLSLTFIIKNLAALCRVAMIRFSWINSGRFKVNMQIQQVNSMILKVKIPKISQITHFHLTCRTAALKTNVNLQTSYFTTVITPILYISIQLSASYPILPALKTNMNLH